MKKVLLGGIGLLCAAAGALVWSSWPSRIDLGSYPEKPVLESRINMDPAEMAPVRLYGFSTGSNQSPEALIFQGGSLTETHVSVFSGVLVEHEKGRFLFEGGIGRDIDDQFQNNMNFWQRELFKFEKDEPAVDQLARAGIGAGDLDFVLLSHLHWDHAGVAADFPALPVAVTEDEYKWAMQSGEGPGFFREQYDGDFPWRFIRFEDGPFETYDRSWDVYGDGSVVVVPFKGHTAGSLGMFVTTGAGERLLFIGDVSWAERALHIPSLRPALTQPLVDLDMEDLREVLADIHYLMKRYPDLRVIPTHDKRMIDTLPSLTER
ncbi:MBL fold metallo-hydrolase [Sneathiella chinensis]|uniref:MBL fold metallo-hydrolase n=1 Tax=Sneathiella chinensis TaxID=349750 RepID=A0ABQ5U8N9_9PROT|nr:MBL fold metallo-hydrolase [Sneathiella chinensis]GLQ07629.1 MBL fold metallo-hydrolase [Sneathiella chinensis]